MTEAQCGLVAQVLPVFMLVVSVRPLVFHWVLAAATPDYLHVPGKALVALLMEHPQFRAMLNKAHVVWIVFVLSLAAIAEFTAIDGAGHGGVDGNKVDLLWIALFLLMLDFVAGTALSVLAE